MTRGEIAARLRAAGIDESAAEARLLFCRFSGLSPAAALAAPEAEWDGEALRDAVRRREEREPLAYILGEGWFFAERYRLSPDCLIPRPETEMLVEYAIAHLPRGGRFADFCTGSGCVAISCAAHRPDCRGEGFDISPGAIRMATENARENGVAERVRFFACDLLDPAAFPGAGGYAMILANPPYITRAAMEELPPEVRREPRAALFGGEDGMDFYRAFLRDYRALLLPGGEFVFEIGYDEGDAIRRAAAEAGYGACRVFPDAAGLCRMAVIG